MPEKAVITLFLIGLRFFVILSSLVKDSIYTLPGSRAFFYFFSSLEKGFSSSFPHWFKVLVHAFTLGYRF